MLLMGHRTFCSCLSALCSCAVHNSAAAGHDPSNNKVSEKSKEGHVLSVKPKISNNLFIEWVELEESFKIS